MQLVDGIKGWAKEWQPLLWIIFTIIGLVGGWQYLDTDESLKVTFDKTPLRIPDVITEPISKENQLFEQATLSDSLRAKAKKLSKKRERAADYLRGIKYYVRVVLYNKSDKALKNTKIKIPNVTEYSGVSVSGDLFTSEKLREIGEGADYDSYKEIVSFPIIGRFPPEATLVVYLWGNVTPSPDLSQPVQAVYDDGRGEVTYTTTVTGLDAYIYSNSLIFLSIFLLMNLFFFVSLAEGYSRSGQNESD